MSKGTKIVEPSFGRRTFLKGSAATMGLAALTGAGCAPKEELGETGEGGGDSAAAEAPEEQIFTGACRGNCFGGCKLKIKVRDGNVVSTTMGEFPNPEYNRICTKGLSHLQRIYDPDRLKVPLRRVGERGADQWEEITWDEAIEEIATTWQAIIDQDGAGSIGLVPSAGGNFGSASTQYPQRLSNALGFTTISPCYDNGLFAGGGFSKGTGVNEITDMPNAKTIIVWGANPSEAQTQHWHFLTEAHNGGSKLITIDPNYTNCAAKSDQWIPIRPATDTAMVMAMMNLCIDNGWTDEDYIKIGTVGPFLVKETDGLYVRLSDVTGEAPAEDAEDPIVVTDGSGNFGVPADIANPVIEGTYEVNGVKATCAYTLLKDAIKDWTVERASELCDVPVEVITELAREYAQEGPSTIYTGLGPDHYVNGHMFYFAVTGLAGITGNLGKPGATCGMDWPVAGFGISAASMPKQIVGPAGVIPGPLFPVSVREGQIEGRPVNLRSLYIYSANPVANQVERKAWIEALNEMELVVIAEMRMTDTARYADIVLPVTHWFEMTEIAPVITPYMTLQEKCIEPLHEAKTDVEIINLIANKMGLVEDFQYTEEEYLAATLDNDNARALGITWEKLKEEKCLRDYPAEPYYLGVDGVFPTPSGREQFYREVVTPYVDYGQVLTDMRERLPYWEPPAEAWPESIGGFEANPLAQKYPLIYSGERNKMKCHTQFGHAPWLLELYSEPIVKLNPDDAAARGIAEGDYVRVFNDRGFVVLKAVIHPGTRPGMIIVPKGWEQDQFVAGHYADLTSHVFNPTVPNNCFFDTLCEVEKYEGGE